MFSRSHTTIRSQLTYLVVTCVLPVWLVAGLLVFHAIIEKNMGGSLSARNSENGAEFRIGGLM
ncbi:MAG TPA: hypothetical protein VN642_17945 [Dongiaceae bacterium]|nr:hypothetical protein [Dongiaceae bacterium]